MLASTNIGQVELDLQKISGSLAASPCSPAIVTSFDCLVYCYIVDCYSFNNNDYSGSGFLCGTNAYTCTQEKMGNKAPFIEEGWGSPTKTSTSLSPLAVPSTTPWAYKEYQLFCWDLVALPTTAAAKERPGYDQKPKIDTIFKNQATHLGLVCKNTVYTQS